MLNPAPEKDKILEIQLEDIIADPSQPRKTFDQESLIELAKSIELYGVLQPIGLRPENEKGQFMIVYGERRFRAAQMVDGLNSIPAMLVESLDPVLQMIENIQRNDLTPMEIGQWIQMRIDQGETSSSIAKQLNKPKDYVSLYKNLASIPDYLQEFYERGLCTSVKSLVRLQRYAKENDQQVRAFCEQIDQPITQQQVNRFIDEEKDHQISPVEQVKSLKIKTRPIQQLKKGIQVRVHSSNQVGRLDIKQGLKKGQACVEIEGQPCFFPVEDLRIEDIIA